MSYRQVIAPNPHIKCAPGWCLKYVRETFGLPARHPTATAAWEASTSKHRDRNFPAGVWLAVWYGLANEPAGHVVLRAPDGSCFSTTNLSTIPRHHPNLADLERVYARANMALSYRGWTEDVAGSTVITANTVTPQSTNEDYMPSAKEVAEALLNYDLARQGDGMSGTTNLGGMIAWMDANLNGVNRGIQNTPSAVWSYTNPSGEEPRDAYQILRDHGNDPERIAAVIPDSIALDVVNALSRRLSE